MQSLKIPAPSPSRVDLPFLELRDVSKSYRTAKGNYTVLQGVNLSVKSGEFVSIIGHSVAAKRPCLISLQDSSVPVTVWSHWKIGGLMSLDPIEWSFFKTILYSLG